MEFFRRYLRQHRLAILLFILSWGLLAAGFALYGLPLAAVAYPALLSLLLCLAAAAWDYIRTLRRHRKLSELQTAANAQLMDLPDPASIGEADCMAAIAALRRAASERETADAARYREMVDYYTAWVHQIKTPIAAMRLTLQPDDTPNARRLMSQLLRIEQYVDMVLMYLRLDEGTSDYVIRACDLDGIIRQSLRKFAGEFIDRRLTLHYEPLHLSVVTDEKWLGFVVEQVLSNALKYTPEGGSITIDAAAPATLCIRDTGIGITAEDLPRIFDRGYTGRNGRTYRQASGIGLYLCRRICRDLGHTITASSAAGEGTVLRLDLSRRTALWSERLKSYNSVRIWAGNVSQRYGSRFPPLLYCGLQTKGGRFYVDSGSQRSAQGVYHPLRRQPRGGPAQRGVHGGAGRICGHHGRIRLRQDHAAEHSGGAGYPYCRHGASGRT